MALSGLDIFKLLPKTNCGDCGVPTCMAFAMKLAQKQAELSQCPHASEEATAALGAASEPPIKLIKLGGTDPLEIGSETVMFRHEKTFFNQPGIGVELKTSRGTDILLAVIKEIEAYAVERVGEELKADLFLITHDSEKAEDFTSTIELAKGNSSKKLILDCNDPAALRAGLELIKDLRPAILLRGQVSEADIDLARTFSASLILTGDSLRTLAGQADKARQAGADNLILRIDTGNLGSELQDNTIMRRSALRNNYKPFGFPLFTYVNAEDGFDAVARASLLLCKYDSIIVLSGFDKALLYTLFTLRQNIYTDPQKPIQVDAKVYPIGEPTPESPVFLTTNFSLTYFMVSGEIENSGISAHLVVAEAEGQSVLTAWAAGKFVGETVAKFFKDAKVEDEIKTRKVVIPGFVAQIQGDLEDGLPGWEVIVGPQEASDIPSFVKNVELT
ncbi:MAG: acetyl-CoA decarbonylase/synthase complex subunit gamma [Candidatus Eisenbacteria bacterium]